MKKQILKYIIMYGDIFIDNFAVYNIDLMYLYESISTNNDRHCFYNDSLLREINKILVRHTATGVMLGEILCNMV